MNNIWEIKENEKICILDLDDVLSYSIEFWVDFVNKKLNTNFRNLNEVKENLSYNKYKELKTEYRECGVKINIPVREEAKIFTEKLKKLNYIIIILTRRPVNLHKKLYSITKEWLEKNKIYYDCLFFEDKKHLKIINDIENAKFIVEDNRYNANIIGSLGYKCYLLNNIYNQGQLNNNVKRINSLLEIEELYYE